MTTCLLSEEDIRKLSRDLQILIATNGTLTRILNIVGNDEIVLQIVRQQVHRAAPKISEFAEFPESRVLQRRVLLMGRSSGVPLVAAESMIAIDFLPSAVVMDLMETDRPIGEVTMASRLETFKEAANVWMGEVPKWVALTASQNMGSSTVARQYRIIIGAQPLIVITEYFLRDIF